MIQAMEMPSFTTSESQEWGRGWADPDIRRQRLSARGGRGGGRSGRRRAKSRRRWQKADTGTVRGRLVAKLGPVRKHR